MTTLVDHEREMAVAGAALDGLAEDRAGFLTITGDLGIGKTRIAQEIRALAEGRGHLVVWGRAVALEADSPFGPLVDALDDHLLSLDAQKLVPPARAQLESIFPALGGPGPADQQGGPGVEQAVRLVLERLADDRPVVLVLEDLHWADDDSVDLLARLLRSPPQAALLIVLSCRSGQWPGVLDRAFRAEEEALSEIHVHALTPEQTDTFLDGRLGADDRRRISRASGGNPFFALELARAAEAGATGVPSSVRAAIDEHLGSLSERAGVLLPRGAAVVGDRFDLDLAAAVAGIEMREARPAHAELVDRGLVEVQTGTLPAFRAPLLRDAVYDGMGVASRLEAHERAARLLAVRGGPAMARAHHVEHAGRVSPADVTLLLDTAVSTMPAEPATAARWFTAALRRMAPRDERVLPTLLHASAALLASGRIAEGRETFDRAVARLPDESLDSPLLLSYLARSEHMLGLAGPSRGLLHSAVTDEIDDRSAARLRIALALDHWRMGDRGGMAREARLAREAARAAGDEHLRANTAGLLGLAEYTAGETAGALEHAREAEDVVAAMSESSPGGLLEALLVLGYLNHGLERYDVANEQFARAIRVARATGNAYFLVPLSAGQAMVEFAKGRLDQARCTVAGALALATEVGNQQLVMWVHTLTALVASSQGRTADAMEAAQQAARGADGVARGFLTTAARCSLGIVWLDAGDFHAAQEQILRSAGGPNLDALDAGVRTQGYVSLATAARHLGELDRAEEWVERAEATASDLALSGRIAIARGARARLLLEEDPHQAALLYFEANEALEAIGRLGDAGRMLAGAGNAVARTGDEPRAVATLERALAILTEAGTQRLADHVARQLRGMGQTISRPPGRALASTGVDALSRREREVAELVAKGMTNKRIAEHLFVSAKTVEDHLARAFTKLGVSSRAGLAAVVEGAKAPSP